MNSITEKNIENLPKTDLKFLNLVEGELVVLKSEVDDKDYRRVYKIISIDDQRLTVEVVSENIINTSKYSQGHNKSNTLVGKVFKNIDARYFQPYF